jgi:hypothetical protein
VRYPIVAMLTVVVAAMLAGARSYAAIGEWCADLNATRRAALGFTGSSDFWWGWVRRAGRGG